MGLGAGVGVGIGVGVEVRLPRTMILVPEGITAVFPSRTIFVIASALPPSANAFIIWQSSFVKVAKICIVVIASPAKEYPHKVAIVTRVVMNFFVVGIFRGLCSPNAAVSSMFFSIHEAKHRTFQQPVGKSVNT